MQGQMEWGGAYEKKRNTCCCFLCKPCPQLVSAYASASRFGIRLPSGCAYTLDRRAGGEADCHGPIFFHHEVLTGGGLSFIVDFKIRKKD